MIYDISSELRNFTYITSVYKCISKYKLRGHQIGRKIGDMLEILVQGLIYRNQDLKDRLQIENKLEGFTTAGHKVEFGFFDNDSLFGAIECKCVGVEETTDGKGSNCLRNIEIGNQFSIDFSSHWLSSQKHIDVNLNSIIENQCNITVLSNTGENSVITLTQGQYFSICIDENSTVFFVKPSDNMIDTIPGLIRICENVYCKTINSDNVIFELRSCLTGPQTIEKAKQASLVAMDLRRKKDGYWGKEELTKEQRQMTFIHILCEFSHWEQKSINVIKTCIDYNLIVADAVINKAFDVFERYFSLTMLDKISKSMFESDIQVRNAVFEVLNYFDNHVLYDIEANSYVSLMYEQGKLVVTQIN